MKQSIRIFIIILGLSLCLNGCSVPQTELDSRFPMDTSREIPLFEPVVPVIQSSYASRFAVLSPQEHVDTSVYAKLCVDNTTNEIVAAANSFERIYPASVTKIMTALLVLEQGNLEDTVIVNEEIILNDPMAVTLGLQVGDQITVDELMHGMLITSANDCAVMLGRYISGSEAAFIELMNQRAWELGATHTHFVNPHGLHSTEHYTTAYDLYLIFQELIKYDAFRTISELSTYTIQYINGTGDLVLRRIQNSNLFISQVYTTPEGVSIVAGKTGTTNEAGYCLIVEASDSQNHDYIAVICGGSTRDALYVQMQELLGEITK